MSDLTQNFNNRCITSTEKVLDVLDCFTPQQPELTLAQVSKILDAPKSSLLNRLRTLENSGFLIKDQRSQTYRLGYKILELAYCARASYSISQFAIPVMEWLVGLTDEIVYLTTCIDGRLFYINCVYPKHRPSAYSIEGRTLPMHCTGCGKAMMSYMEEKELDEIINRIGLQKFTEYTFCDRDSLFTELKQIRERGYALDNQEQMLGVSCVAMAIRGFDGNVVGALSISGSPITMKPETTDKYVGYLAQACNELMPYSSLFPYHQIKTDSQ